MSVPAIVTDGNWNVPSEDGFPVYAFPFTARGDFTTFTATVTKSIDWQYYEPPISMTQRWFEGLGLGYLVDFNAPTSKGQGLLMWQEVYASMPKTGVEYGNATYTVQTYKINPMGIDSELQSYSDTFNSKLVYEYSLYAPLPQILQTKLQLLPREDNGGALTVCVVGSEVSTLRNIDELTAQTATNVLAQNTTSKIYKGQIFERLSVFVSPQYPRILQVAPIP